MARKPRRDPTDPSLQARVRELVTAGLTYEAIAKDIGVSKRTLERWRQRGADGDPRFVAFVATIKEAEDDGRASAEGAIRAAWDKGAWQAAAWWLERKWPNEYARRTFTDNKTEHSGSIDLKGMTPQQLRALRRETEEGE